MSRSPAFARSTSDMASGARLARGGVYLVMRQVVGTGVSLVAMFFVTPHFFLGFFTAGFFSRTVKAQLLWGFLLSLLFASASLALIFVGCSTMKF